MKIKTVYICSNCSYTSGKWIGKCPGCESWNSFVEDAVANSPQIKKVGISIKPKTLSSENSGMQKYPTGISELDNALSGGICRGGLLLMGGEPGIGKSTLSLQLCDSFLKQNLKVLYVSGEEGVGQVANRGERLKMDLGNINFIQEYALENIIETIKDISPDLVIIDSIQVIHSQDLPGMAGSVSQVRSCTEALMELTKKNNFTTILIGHVTKDGNLAGPRVLEHLVDTVLQIEGERYKDLRIVRSLKNRFGPTNEVAIMEMTQVGLKSIDNPSEKLLSERPKEAVGSCLACIVEGKRPLIVEVQALTTKSVFGYPKRSATGFDLNRLNMIIAVLQKHLKLNLLNSDVFVNVIGGFKINDPATDLAVCAAIYSSVKQTPIPHTQVYLGEVGLSGEIRKSSMEDRRLKEISGLKLESVSNMKHVKDLV